MSLGTVLIFVFVCVFDLDVILPFSEPRLALYMSSAAMMSTLVMGELIIRFCP